MTKRELPRAHLLDVLDYEPETGVFIWKKPRCWKAKVGSPAGGLRPDGYLSTMLLGKRYLLHRLAWFYVHGKWPEHEIDHINGCRTDNRISNLRDVSTAENRHNIDRAFSTNKSCGVLGVSKRKNIKQKTPYIAQIMANGKRRVVGYFNTAEAAHAAYLKAKDELHPTHKRLKKGKTQ